MFTGHTVSWLHYASLSHPVCCTLEHAFLVSRYLLFGSIFDLAVGGSSTRTNFSRTTVYAVACMSRTHPSVFHAGVNPYDPGFRAQNAPLHFPSTNTSGIIGTYSLIWAALGYLLRRTCTQSMSNFDAGVTPLTSVSNSSAVHIVFDQLPQHTCRYVHVQVYISECTLILMSSWHECCRNLICNSEMCCIILGNYEMMPVFLQLRTTVIVM